MQRILSGLLLAMFSISMAVGQAVVDPKTRKVDLKGTYTAPHRETIEVYLNGQNDILQQIDARLKKLESGAVVVTPPVSPTMAVPTPGVDSPPAGSTAYFADSTKYRVDESKMNDYFVNSEAELRNAGQADLTDKRVIPTFPRFTGELEIAGAWINVMLKARTLHGFEMYRADYSTSLIFNQRKVKERVEVWGVVLRSDYKGAGNPMAWSTELIGFKGIKWSYCSFIAHNKGNYNALGMVQYSDASRQGEVSESVFVSHCYFENIPRMDLEFTAQGKDKIRIKNVVVTNCVSRRDSVNPGEKHRMFSSIVGAVTDVYEENNDILNAKDIAVELVHVDRAIVRNCKIRAYLETCNAYSFTDDGFGLTRNITVEGGTVDVTGRPFVLSRAKQVTINPKNNVWKGHRGGYIIADSSRLINFYLLIHSTEYEGGIEVDGESKYVSISNGTVDGFGAVAAGYRPLFETIVARKNTSFLQFNKVTTKLSITPQRTYLSSGAILLQGELNKTTSTIIDNPVMLEQ